MTINIPREFRAEVKIGANDITQLADLLHRLGDHVGAIKEDLARLKVTGFIGPDGSELKVMKTPIETVTELLGGG